MGFKIPKIAEALKLEIGTFCSLARLSTSLFEDQVSSAVVCFIRTSSHCFDCCNGVWFRYPGGITRLKILKKVLLVFLYPWFSVILIKGEEGIGWQWVEGKFVPGWGCSYLILKYENKVEHSCWFGVISVLKISCNFDRGQLCICVIFTGKSGTFLLKFCFHTVYCLVLSIFVKLFRICWVGVLWELGEPSVKAWCMRHFFCSICWRV